jgi:RNA polymerase sigma-70 factor (ECF subfamily)
VRQLTEQQIVEAVRRGRREGQDAMVCRYAERVFAMIVRQVDEMDAQELAQDTFLRAFSHIDSYDPQKASLSTWLCRIAYRLTLDFLKRRRPLIVSIEESEVWQEDISDEQLESELSTGREERIQRLQELIDELPDEERLLLTLYYFEDRPLTEIAYITGIEPGPLANRLYRTRKKLLLKLKN